MTEYCLGLMSGTSMDGVDAVIASFSGGRFERVELAHHEPYPPSLRERLLQVARDAPALTLHEFLALDARVADAFAVAANAALRRTTLPVRAIGCHGQTVFHAPGLSTLQIGDPNRIAARTHLAVVADFRRMDMAFGGQGAPLVPAFHHALYAESGEPRCVVNLGGIANATLLPDAAPGRVRGFDTGPANGLLDEWAELHFAAPFDRDGAVARSGTLHEGLLAALLADDWFRRPPPKSTGRDRFNLAWVAARFPGVDSLPPADVMTTLAELTARSIALQIAQHAPATQRVLLCGGGVRNAWLVERLAAVLAPRICETTQARGLDPQHVEAAAFAWLAMRRLRGEPGNLPAVTGAQRSVVLGAIYAGEAPVEL